MSTARGFTLAEILVVLAITTVIGGLVFANFGSFREDQALNNAEADLGNLIHLAQANSISAVKCVNPSGVSIGDASWSLEFKTTRGDIDLRCSTTTSLGVTTTTLVQTMKLGGVYVNAINGSCVSSFQSGTSPTANPIFVSFAPLYGTTTFQDSGAACIASSETLAIILKDTKTGSTKTVKVGRGGGLLE